MLNSEGVRMNINTFAKKLVKGNKFLTAGAYYIRKVRCNNKMKKYAEYPLDNKKVIFYRSGGGYGDNPKAIAEYLHLNFPDIKLVWACSDSKVYRDSIPSFVTPVVFETESFFKELSTAGAWVCSTTLPNGTIKRKEQLYVQTWHGDKFLKKIGNDAVTDVKEYKNRTYSRKFCENDICDYYVTGCEWFVPIASSALGYNGKFLRCGMPRNDCLVKIDKNNYNAIKTKLELDTNVRVLIYAPTFRDYEKAHDEIGSNIDLVRILDTLEKKYNKKWICLLRAHDGTLLKLKGGKITDKRFFDVTTYPDMADLLMISDMLITDYSSCGADFAITGKMVLMYQDDIEQYTSKGRTLYFSREESPYFTASSMEEAIEIINKVTEEDIKRNSQGILDFYDSFETGHACEEVCKVIIDSLKCIKSN